MRRRAHLGSVALEQLLDGDARDGTPLAQVLTAARAAGTPEELAGLDAARVAFTSAQQAPRPSVAMLPAVTRTTAGRLLALKVLAAISGATLIGGVAYAASGGRLLGGGSSHDPGQRSSTSAPSSAGSSTLQLPPGQVTERATTKPNSTSPHPSRATTPNRGRGASVTLSVRPTQVPPVPTPLSAAPTTPPAPPSSSNPAPSPTPTGHAKTTPTQRPSSPGGTHSAHPSATRGR